MSNRRIIIVSSLLAFFAVLAFLSLIGMILTFNKPVTVKLIPATLFTLAITGWYIIGVLGRIKGWKP